MTDTAANTPLTAELVRLPQMSRLALCVGADMLDVVVTSKVEDNSMIWRRIPLSGTSGSTTRALEEAVYDNPLLLAPFSRTDIVFDTCRFLVVPADRATDDRADAMLETLYPGVEFEPLVNEIPGNAVIASAVDADLMRFTGRTFPEARRMHRLTPLCRYFGGRNRGGNGGRMHVHLHGNFVDIVAYSTGYLLTANTFEAADISDALYFILAAAAGISFDDNVDRMMLSGDAGRREALMPMLRKYYPHAMPAIFPSAMLRAGSQALAVPFELSLLPICE